MAAAGMTTGELHAYFKRAERPMLWGGVVHRKLGVSGLGFGDRSKGVQLDVDGSIVVEVRHPFKIWVWKISLIFFSSSRK